MSGIQTVFAIIEASEADMRLVQAAVADLARPSLCHPLQNAPHRFAALKDVAQTPCGG